MKYSVIVPVYNKANTIADSIQSILGQLIDDYEIIIVDDGSTDNVKTVLPRDERISYIYQENAGVSVARNTGIEKSQGEYICFLDADDLWLPNHLKTLTEFSTEYPDVNCFVTSHKTVYENGNELHSNEKLGSIEKNYLLTDNLFSVLNEYGDGVINTNSMCIARKIFFDYDLWFEPGEKIGEDTDLWFRVALREKVLLSKIETTVYRREHSTATKQTSNTLSWAFSRRENEILSNMNVDESRKKECIRLLDRYKMACARELKLCGRNEEAKERLSMIVYRSGKRYILTKLFCFMPVFLCKLVKGFVR